MKTYRKGDRLSFGKHRGQTFDYVCQFDPGYIDWMHANRLCDLATLERMHRGEYTHRKLPDGYAIVLN